MYQIYIKKNSVSKPLFMAYEIDGEVWSTDDVAVLEEKYLELLKTYPSEQLKAIHDLSTEILVEIEPCV